jgi:hypothetical protein
VIDREPAAGGVGTSEVDGRSVAVGDVEADDRRVEALGHLLDYVGHGLREVAQDVPELPIARPVRGLDAVHPGQFPPGPNGNAFYPEPHDRIPTRSESLTHVRVGRD